MATRAIITMPRTARRGEVIEIRTLLQHPMNSGFQVDAEGRNIERYIVQRFECRDGGELIFGAELHPAVAANPYIAFHTVATASSTLVFRWTGDRGFVHVESVALNVT
jgi:sulfur-oxidizing protein SoxZ